MDQIALQGSQSQVLDVPFVLPCFASNAIQENIMPVVTDKLSKFRKTMLLLMSRSKGALVQGLCFLHNVKAAPYLRDSDFVRGSSGLHPARI